VLYSGADGAHASDQGQGEPHGVGRLWPCDFVYCYKINVHVKVPLIVISLYNIMIISPHMNLK